MNYNIFDKFRAVAKIDFLKTDMPNFSNRDLLEDSPVLEKLYHAVTHGNGTINAPTSAYRKKYETRDDRNWLTFHDIRPKAISFLIQHYGITRVREIEFSIDFFQKDKSSNSEKNEELRAHLVRCLVPTEGLIRKTYDVRKNVNKLTGKLNEVGGYFREGLAASKKGTTTKYYNANTPGKMLRIYTKNDETIDKATGEITQVQFIRLEINLSGGELGIQFNPDDCRHWVSSKTPGIDNDRYRIEFSRYSGVALDKIPESGEWVIAAKSNFTIAMLPKLFESLRAYLSPFFKIAKGIKPNSNRSITEKSQFEADKETVKCESKWRKYGAEGATKNGHSLAPDIVANRMIGCALKDLQKCLQHAQTCKKKGENLFSQKSVHRCKPYAARDTAVHKIDKNSRL